MSGRGRGDLVAGGMLPSTELGVLPPILEGHGTPQVEKKVRSFYGSIAEIFERWVKRRKSPHTQRAYRTDVLSFINFLEIDWPKDAHELLLVSVAQVQEFRDQMVLENKAGKTLNRRISSISSFYKYLSGVATEFRLPIQVPNPAHAQFIDRADSDPEEETQALTLTRARQLMSLAAGDSVLDGRDRAVIKFYLYSGCRIGTGCRLLVSDVHHDSEETSVRVKEKGGKKRTIGLHYAAGEAIQSYIDAAGISSGPLFRARLNSRSNKLGDRPISERSMYRIVQGYLDRVPGGMKDGECRYTPHSLRATTATLALDAGIPIEKVQELLGHRHITTTQIYDKRRRRTSEGASHELPF